MISSLSASQLLGHEALLSHCARHPPASHTAALQAPIWQQLEASAALIGPTFCPKVPKPFGTRGLATIFVSACRCCRHRQVKPAASTVPPAQPLCRPAGSATARFAQTHATAAAALLQGQLRAPASPKTKRVICITFLGSTATFLSANSHSLVQS